MKLKDRPESYCKVAERDINYVSTTSLRCAPYLESFNHVCIHKESEAETILCTEAKSWLFTHGAGELLFVLSISFLGFLKMEESERLKLLFEAVSSSQSLWKSKENCYKCYIISYIELYKQSVELSFGKFRSVLWENFSITLSAVSVSQPHTGSAQH